MKRVKEAALSVATAVVVVVLAVLFVCIAFVSRVEAWIRGDKRGAGR